MDGLVVKLFFRDVDQDSGVKEMYTLMFPIISDMQLHPKGQLTLVADRSYRWQAGELPGDPLTVLCSLLTVLCSGGVTSI